MNIWKVFSLQYVHQGIPFDGCFPSVSPRPPDIQICVLASDGIGRAIIRICPILEHQSE